MKESKLKLKLEKALNNVENITGVDGTLVVNNQGEILYNSLSYADEDLFGSMANIISSSSEKLLELSKQGSTERVLVESVRGKALFLNMEKVHLVVLTNIKANIGMVILSSKKSAQLIKDLEEIKQIPDYIEEIEVEEVTRPLETVPGPEYEYESKSESEKLITNTETDIIVKTSLPEKPQKEVVGLDDENEAVTSSDVTSDYVKISNTDNNLETEKVLAEENTLKEPTLKENISVEEIATDFSDLEKEVIEDLEIESQPEKLKDSEPSKMDLPVIKPPLSFPKLPDSVQVSENPEEKSKLIIDIYEAVLLAMSIGASKIMGTAPARGMLKNSIPYDDCPELLDGVDVRSNSSIQFDIIRKNIDKFPTETRSEKTIDDFTTIISAITEKYGRVMGYDAFRGMIRPEFKKIYDSFGPAMEELGIKEKIHPELR
ncbi:MAG TPA: roadblock/LC7 domain-containing protein, partial [Methanobacteriaceae archaeon]|nr:roadblock/LC7 domain-containing protein [Methanobacteriaceae archaeon]